MHLLLNIDEFLISSSQKSAYSKLFVPQLHPGGASPQNGIVLWIVGWIDSINLHGPSNFSWPSSQCELLMAIVCGRERVVQGWV